MHTGYIVSARKILNSSNFNCNPGMQNLIANISADLYVSGIKSSVSR